MRHDETSGAIRRPKPSGAKDRDYLLKRNTRKTVPLRKAFVQAPRGSESRKGPLSDFVANGDMRGLSAYLIALAATGKINEDGWSTTLDSLVWARLMDADEHATQAAARRAAWRVFTRLQDDRGLIKCSRPLGDSNKIRVILLREDGSGEPYTPPGQYEDIGDRYLRIPTSYWTNGKAHGRLKLPGLAMLLALLAEKPWSAFPAERMPEWYGWSADTTERGLHELLKFELADRREVFKEAPLTPVGSTLTYQYKLKKWLLPKAGQSPISDITSTEPGDGTAKAAE